MRECKEDKGGGGGGRRGGQVRVYWLGDLVVGGRKERNTENCEYQIWYHNAISFHPGGEPLSWMGKRNAILDSNPRTSNAACGSAVK